MKKKGHSVKEKGHSANGRKTTPFAVAWKALLAVAVFGLALGVIGCGKKSRSSSRSSARESSSSSSASEPSSSKSQVETKVCVLPGGVKLEMVHVEPGSFVMGDKDEEKRLERITEGFWLGKFEVTQAQWEAVMGENPSDFKGADNPVETVSWDDCQEFLKKLNALPAVKESGLVFRLPTEKEWEYACRAGSKGDYCKLADGTETTERTLGEVAWYEDNSGGKTHLVGQKTPNAFGLYDMHGNVWEWCEDLYLAGRSDRVRRGGSWRCDSGNCQASFRNCNLPDYRYDFLGFRLAAFQDVNR